MRPPTRIVDLLFPLRTPDGKIERVTVRPMSVEEYAEFRSGPDGIWRALARAAGLPPEMGSSFSDVDAERIANAVDDNRVEYFRRRRLGLPDAGSVRAVRHNLRYPVEAPGGRIERLLVGPLFEKEGRMLKNGPEGEVHALASAAGVCVDVILEMDPEDYEGAWAAAHQANLNAVAAGYRMPRPELVS